MKRPRILVLHNEPTLPADHPDADAEYDILDTADAVVRHLQEAGLAAGRFGFVDDARALIQGVSAFEPDAIFNLYEGTAAWGNSEAYAAGVLDLLRVPYTGSPPAVLLLARSKPLTKHLLAGAGLSTAPFVVLDGTAAVPSNPLTWPVIVKPAHEDASVGIDQSSVVTTQEALIDRVAYLRRHYGPGVLIEQFIRGREFHVPVWDRGDGPRVLPFTEIFFLGQNDPDPIWPIVSFDAKWKPDSRDYKSTPAKNPADVDDELFRRVADLAVRAFELTGCRDYARIDFRVDEQGTPYILEVNPNPCISPLAGIAEALTSSKISFGEFVIDLVKSALRRGPTSSLAEFESAASIPTAASAAPSKPDWEILKAGDSRFVVKDPAGEIGVIESNAIADASRGYRLVVLHVAETHRRRGIATLLLATLEAHLKAQNSRFLIAETTSHAKFSALRQFLAVRGFKPAGEIPDYEPDGASRLNFIHPFAPNT
jgi:D-alanine-D-alanine ligase